MQLTRVERWILYNQALILKHLEPEHSKRYDELAEALLEGFEAEYASYCPVLPDDEKLPEEKCQEVADILDMFSHLKVSFDALSPQDRKQHNLQQIHFPGFDGNNETAQLAYAQFFCHKGDGRFPELGDPNNFNSHCRMLSRYQAMLAVWHQYPRGEYLSAPDIVRIMNAR